MAEQEALAVQDLFTYIIKIMWAIIDKITGYVYDAIAGMSYEKALESIPDNCYLVPMTLDNSPGYKDGYYDGKKFYRTKEEITNG